MAADGETQRLHIFGIRHHGPGSAVSLLAALNELVPASVRIEGPPDANDIIAFASSPAMTPPLAILVHGQEDPANASFYPFAIYSPEWQAMRWATAKCRPVRFIDLPAANRLALTKQTAAQEPGENDGETTNVAPEESGTPPPPTQPTAA